MILRRKPREIEYEPGRVIRHRGQDYLIRKIEVDFVGRSLHIEAIEREHWVELHTVQTEDWELNADCQDQKSVWKT